MIDCGICPITCVQLTTSVARQRVELRLSGPAQKESQVNVSREQSRNVGHVKFELALSTSEQFCLAASQSDLQGLSRVGSPSMEKQMGK